MKVIVVGANAAGVACAARLRRHSEAAHIILVDSRAIFAGENELRAIYNIDVRLGVVVQGQYPNLLVLQDTLAGSIKEEQFEHLCYFDPQASTNEGRRRADELMGLFRPQVDKVSVFHPHPGNIAYAEIGLNEAALIERQMDYIYSVLPTDKGYLKLLYNNTGQIYGFCALGQGVPRYVDAMSAIMAHGGTVNSLISHEAYGQLQSLPTLGKIAQNVIEGRLKNTYPDEINELELENVTLLDVRSQNQTNVMNFPFALEIPLAQLRYEFYQLEIEKPIVLISQTGKSAYIASRLLSGRGYKCSVLTGGLEYYVYASSRTHGI